MADPFDTGYELLPPDEGELTADQALEAALLAPDLGDEPEAELDPRPIGKSWDFDFATGQFRRNGQSPAVVTEEASLRVWIEKALRTPRLAYPIYSDQYGTDFPASMLIGHTFSPEAIGLYTDALKEALLVHDRITAVKDIRYTGDPADNFLEVSFTVVLDEDDTEFPIEGMPVGGGV